MSSLRYLSSGVRACGWLGIASLAALVVPPSALAQSAADPVGRAVQAMESAAGAPIEVTRSSVTGLATFVRATSRPMPAGARPGAPAPQTALAFVAGNAAFGIRDSAGLRVDRVRGPDAVGMEHVRLRQLHDGVPVTGGELTVHLRGQEVIAVHAKTLADLQGVETTATVGAAGAASAARNVLASIRGVTDAVLRTPRLEIFNRGLLEGRVSPTRLAWFIEATRLDLREFIWVDAHTGGVLLHFSQLAQALDRAIHDTEDTDILPGTLVRAEGEPATGDRDTDRAYDYVGDTYDYFLSEHGRDSYDGGGAALIASVHYCAGGSCPMQNAFWSGTQVVFGDGYAAVDDVVAHEVTHAVTDHSASLFYYMQSGALNESFSDIFGETVDLTNGSGTDTPAARWLHGEDVPAHGANRDMMVPTAKGDPGRMSDADFECDARRDNGGVHANSGVPNHAYALMVDGGAYNGVAVTGIGLTKAALMHYRALTEYLVSASNFLDHDNALRQSCTDLVGTAGITAGDCANAAGALDAVELSGPWPCTPNQPGAADLCPSGAPAIDLFFDDLENPAAGNWIIQPLGGEVHWQYPPPSGAVFATSGVQNFFGENTSRVGDSAIAMTADVAIAATGLRMQFRHAYGFEDDATIYRDGGVIEYSLDGGTNWLDAGSLISGGAQYGGTIASDRMNPLGGRSAFVAESFGYTASRLDLTSLAGASVRFRFRMGTDDRRRDDGWFIDDVRISSCACGNGSLDAGEQCDDGNAIDCDGCDRSCTPTTTCGNGAACAPEQCDDGNASGGDCCSPTCQFEPSGGSCDDAHACTLSDACDGSGECVAGTASAAMCDDGSLCTTESCDPALGCVYVGVDCDDGDTCTQDSCEPSSGCANSSTPRTDCRAPGVTELRIKNRTDDARDTLVWRWLKGEKTLLPSLGDPQGATDHTLCLYTPGVDHQIVTASGAGTENAVCSGTTKVLGGGVVVPSVTFLHESRPESGGTGWRATAQDNAFATAYAVCADVDASYEIVSTSGGGTQNPACPGSKKVVGGGAVVPSFKFLHESRPESDGTGWRATAQDDDFVIAYAVCADVDGSYEIVSASGGGTQHPACSGSKKVMGGGAVVPSFKFLHESRPESDGSGWSATAQDNDFVVAYGVCADQSLAVPRADVPGGGTCGDDPCWSAYGSPVTRSYRYADPAADADGIARIELRTGAAHKASVRVRGGGGLLPDLTLPLPLPLTVQLVNSDRECWTATYTSPAAKNDPEGFVDKER